MVEKPTQPLPYATPPRRKLWASWWEAASLGCVALELLAAAVALDAGLMGFYGGRSPEVLWLAVTTCGLTAAVGMAMALVGLARRETRSRVA